MITVNIRKQGGAAIMTIPSDVLKMLDAEIGTILHLEVADGAFIARPNPRLARKRYTLAELLRGVTRKKMATLNAETAWARVGKPLGRELA
ncbi:MAG: hypothetical protein ABSD20_01645 [Terriglobales bacterium]|jgi:antitoxin ChpS